MTDWMCEMPLEANSENLWLAVDVGNSQIKAGLFSSLNQQASSDSNSERSNQSSAPNDSRLPACLGFHSTSLAGPLPWDDICGDRQIAEQFHCVIAGSNQQGVDRLVSEWPQWLPQPVVIRDSKSFPIDIQVDEPRKVGLDRLLNAVAANSVRDTDREAIIVSCGTATTIDLVSDSGSFRGGAILPGFTLCARALNQYTEVLPFISMDELFDLPPSEDCHPALGSNTQAAIMSGVFWGQIGAVRELITRLSHHSAGHQQSTASDDSAGPQVFLTGGGSRLLVPYFPDAVHYPYLPLQGLVLAVTSNESS